LASHGADQAAVLALHLAKAGQRGQHAQFFQVGRVHRAHQRFDQPIEDFAPQPAAHEPGHALVGVVRARRNEILERRAKLAQRTEDRRDGQRPHPRGGHHQKAVGQRVQSPPPHHERPPMRRTGLDKLVGQSESLAELDAPGNRGDEVVGALFDLKSILADGGNHAAEPAGRFEQRHLALRIEFHQPMRSRQAGDAAADDRKASASGWDGTHADDSKIPRSICKRKKPMNTVDGRRLHSFSTGSLPSANHSRLNRTNVRLS
jgi:hypothetical protein